MTPLRKSTNMVVYITTMNDATFPIDRFGDR